VRINEILGQATKRVSKQKLEQTQLEAFPVLRATSY